MNTIKKVNKHRMVACVDIKCGKSPLFYVYTSSTWMKGVDSADRLHAWSLSSAILWLCDPDKMCASVSTSSKWE